MWFTGQVGPRSLTLGRHATRYLVITRQVHNHYILEISLSFTNTLIDRSRTMVPWAGPSHLSWQGCTEYFPLEKRINSRNGLTIDLHVSRSCPWLRGNDLKRGVDPTPLSVTHDPSASMIHCSTARRCRVWDTFVMTCSLHANQLGPFRPRFAAAPVLANWSGARLMFDRHKFQLSAIKFSFPASSQDISYCISIGAGGGECGARTSEIAFLQVVQSSRPECSQMSPRWFSWWNKTRLYRCWFDAAELKSSMVAIMQWTPLILLFWYD